MRHPRAGRGEGEHEAGFTTAEFAVGFPAVMVVLLLSAALLGLLLDQIRCVDAARAAARSVARGDAVAVAEKLARETAPEGAAVRIHKGRTVRVEVIGPVRYTAGRTEVHAEAEAAAPNESHGLHGRRLGSLGAGPIAAFGRGGA